MSVLRHPAALAAPPAGVRINLGSVCAEVKVSFQHLADATATSKASMWRLATENHWPAGFDQAELRAQIEALLLARGATPDQLATVWHAHTRRPPGAGPRTTDSFGRPLDVLGQRLPPEPKAPRAPRALRGNPQPNPKDTDMLLAKQVLRPEARKHFALFTNPFDGEVTSAQEMYVNAEIRFIREACWQAATAGRFVALVGESGAGKTTLLADLKERIATDRKPTVVIEPSVLGMEGSDARGKQLRAGDILTAIIMTLQPGATVAQSSERRTRQAEALLAGSTTAGNSHCLLIEEAHALPVSTLKHLKRLHERMRLHGRKPMLGILLLGQPELLDTLSDKRHDVREVVQRVEVVVLQPLDHDLQSYLEFRCQAVDRKLASLMSPCAVNALRARLTVLRQGVRNSAVSMCYPLAVNNLVIAALNEAAIQGVPLVNRDVVEAL
jgi:type II secretory pathway predicted ATPase ExeA